MDFNLNASAVGLFSTDALSIQPSFLIAPCLLLASCIGDPKTGEDDRANLGAVEYLVQAQDALRAGRFSVAVALADSAERHGNENDSFLADVHFLRARIYDQLNREDSARAAYERTLRLEPDYRGAHLNLGNSAFRAGQFSEAIEQYRQEYERYGEPITLVYIGRSYAELGDVDRAREAYERAMAADQSLAEAYVRMAELLDREGNPNSAIPHARRAVELEPANMGYRYLFGRVLLRTGAPEEALQHLNAVLAERPGNHEVHYNLGQALARLGRSVQASKHLATADSLRDVNREVGEWETLTRLHPERPAVWATYGFALETAGRGAEAARAYKVAQYLDPSNPDIRFALANLHLKQGELDTALSQYAWILGRDSTHVGAWVNAGIAQARRGNRDAARDSWQHALKLQPDNPAAKSYLAQLEANVRR